MTTVKTYYHRTGGPAGAPTSGHRDNKHYKRCDDGRRSLKRSDDERGEGVISAAMAADRLR